MPTLYESSRLLASQSYQQWVSTELFSFGWFFTLGILAIIYVIWLKLVDTDRLSQLLLLGSLSAIGFVIGELVLIELFGVTEYKIRPIPFIPPLFIVSITKAPVLFMLAQQYSTSWKIYAWWAAAGSAVLSFGLFPLYSLIGIFQLHNWNYFYQFIYLFTNGLFARGLLLLVLSLEQGYSFRNGLNQVFGGLQPAAAKPLAMEKSEKTDTEQ